MKALPKERKIIPDSYQLANPWNKQDFRKLNPRVDPHILAPMHVMVHAINGSLGLIPYPDYVDPLALDETADKDSKTPPKAKAPRPKPRANSGSSGSMGFSSFPLAPILLRLSPQRHDISLPTLSSGPLRARIEASLSVGRELRNGDCGQDADDGHHDQQFDQRETALEATPSFTARAWKHIGYGTP